MNTKSLLNLIRNFEKLNNSSLIELKEIIDRYPYFAGGQLLYLLNLKKLNDGRFQQKLPNTSIRLPNRSLLKLQIEKISQNTNYPLEKTIDETTLGSTFRKQDIFSLLPSPSPALPKTPVKKSATEREILEKTPRKKTVAKKTETVKSTSEKTKNAKSNAKSKSENTQEDLINRFLQKKETIIKPRKEKDYTYDDNDDNSLKESIENSSETLAKLYISQGLVTKAIEVYEYLSLKYPEKSRFFAKEIKKAKNNNKQK